MAAGSSIQWPPSGRRASSPVGNSPPPRSVSTTLSELCDFLDLPRPDPSQANETLNTYVIDKTVYLQELDGSTTPNLIDLYRRSCVVLEAKQGSNPIGSPPPEELPRPATRNRRGTAIRGTPGWDQAMLKARAQAERYAKPLPASEGWPPFLIRVDVGHSIELYADFSLTGKAYLPFPDPPQLPHSGSRTSYT
jgi:hypothetical protein